LRPLKHFLTNMKIILASQSLRRRQLLEEIGFKYELLPKDVEESYPPHLQCEEIVTFLAEKKSMAFTDDEIPDDALVLTADTIVWLDGNSLLKPTDEEDAIAMLGKLSGRKHRVATGVCLRSKNKKKDISCVDGCFLQDSFIRRTHLLCKEVSPL